MVWKIFSLLAAVVLGAAAYYANASKSDLKEEKASLTNAKKHLAEAQARHTEADGKIKAKTDQHVALQGDLTKAKDDVVKAEADAKEKEAARDLAKVRNDELQKQLAAVQKEIDDAGNIEQLLAQVNELKMQQAAAEQDLANNTQSLAAVQEKLAATTKESARLAEVEANARKGVMETTFTASVAQAFGDWGFVVLSKGNAGGVIADADLEVKRGSALVAKLKVRNVEQNISVADIIPDSLAEGDAIRGGDLVSVAPREEKPTTEVAPPTPVPAAPTPNAAADPFAAGGMAPAAAPAATDPFGGAPAAPAAAPAAADPFGGAPAAPAGGMAPAPAAADPFGGAPAAPAAGAGTKESPSTADPFAKP